MQSQRFNYILQLRGAAALSVVFYHHCHFFWTHQDFCARLTHHQPIETAPQIATILSAIPINLGDLGVATFFLISGFLMPIVAQQKTRLQFITRRIKRIYPPYLIALLLVLLLGYCYAQYESKPYQWLLDHIIASLLLVRDIAQYPFIDGIVWTLEIELKFYLLCMLALPWLSKNPVRFIGLVIGLSALILVASSVKPYLSYPDGLHLLRLSAKTMHLITFIGFGVVLSFWHQQRLSLVEVMIATVMLAILYFSHGIDRNIPYQEMISYALALLVFIGSYLARHKFTDQNVLAQTGKISYSLYLMHGVPGFFMLYALVSYGAGIAITVALIYSMVAALIFYRLIERPLLKQQSTT